MSTAAPISPGHRVGGWFRWLAATLRQRPWLYPFVGLLLLPGFLVLAAGLIALVLYATMVLWAWIVPDLFPGAVAQGLIAAHVSWLTAGKILIAALLLRAVLTNATATYSHKS